MGLTASKKNHLPELFVTVNDDRTHTRGFAKI